MLPLGHAYNTFIGCLIQNMWLKACSIIFESGRARLIQKISWQNRGGYYTVVLVVYL